MRHILVISAFLFSDALTAAEPPVTALCFTPDGKAIVVASQSGIAIRNWPDLAAVAKPGVFETELANVRDVAFSPNGKRLAVAGGAPAEEGIVDVWFCPEGKRLAEFQGPDDPGAGVAWSDNHPLHAARRRQHLAGWDL
ncbi:MAG: hypothetical protein H8E37_13715, partial [Planctomycetes bacterium]|nr:hypothetical protein [Planctomycetota bacterium]